MPLRPVLAELLGTFLLTLVVLLAGGISVPVAAALTLGLLVYTIGWISGAHVNPAITVALATVKKISFQDAVYYLLAQFIGAFLASIVAWKLSGQWSNAVVGNTAMITIAEAMGTFLLAWGVMSAVEGKVSKGASGLVVGGSLLLGVIIAAGAGSAGVINPAVALGVHSFSAAYLVGPIVGSIAAAWLYRWFMGSHDASPTH